MVAPMMLRLMEMYVKEAGGALRDVPLTAYDTVFAEAEARVRGVRPAAVENPRVLDTWMRDACTRLARQYPRPKPYAKKRAVGR